MAFEPVLQRGLSKYKYKDQARNDILALTRQYTDLRPKIEWYVFNTGERKELVCLEGTIPVNYRGSTYNIPICLWLMDTHPYNPPLAFVKPTQNMQIKPSRHVDISGRIYLPFLTEWKHPTHDLVGLVGVLSIIFGEECPVFSKTTRPSYPPAGGVGARPPYPVAGAGYNTGMPMPGAQPPSYPYPQSGGYPPASTAYGSGYPQSSSYPSQGSGYPPYSQTPGYPGYPTPASTTLTGSSGHAPLTSQPSITDEQLKASLLSATEDKMRRRLKEIFGRAQAEVEVLNRTQDDLNKNKQKLDDMIEKLEKEQADVDRNLQILQEKSVELREALQKLDESEEVNIDEAVITTAPIYKQLLNAFAEEQAIEDAIYYLSEALRREVIDLDVFLKQVREMSRKQFMLRALITKCRQKAGLPDVAS